MAVTPAQRAAWHQRLRAEATELQARQAEARDLAFQAAALLLQGWPALEGVWLFGSLHEGRFAQHSDVDLAAAGLPPGDLLQAMAVLETLQRTMAIDLVRLEELPSHWQQRIRERGERLS